MPKIHLENKLQCEALALLEIRTEDWNELTPSQRRERYHRKIMLAIRENHPDRHASEAPDSLEGIAHLENTKRLNALNYEDSISLHDEEVTTDTPSPSEATATSSSSELGSARVFIFPKTYKELLSSLRVYSHEGMYTNNWYYQAVKECMPNIVPWEKFPEIQKYSGDGFGLVLDQMITKLELRGYRGVEVFVSAMVSENHARIKNSFDAMVNHLKHDYTLYSFFSSKESRLAEFIEHFCLFNERPGKTEGSSGCCIGIPQNSVILLCKSLSLNLPYHIIDPIRDELDDQLIHELLTKYVKGEGLTPLLENDQSASLLTTFKP